MPMSPSAYALTGKPISPTHTAKLNLIDALTQNDVQWQDQGWRNLGTLGANNTPTQLRQFNQDGQKYFAQRLAPGWDMAAAEGTGYGGGIGAAQPNPAYVYRDKGENKENYRGEIMQIFDDDFKKKIGEREINITEGNSYKKAIAAAAVMAGGVAMLGGAGFLPGALPAGIPGAAEGAAAAGWAGSGAGAVGAAGAAASGQGLGTGNGAFLGEGMSSGVPAWDAAAVNAGGSLTTPLTGGLPPTPGGGGGGSSGGILDSVTSAKGKITEMLAKIGLSGKDAAALLAALASSGGGSNMPGLEYNKVPIGGGTVGGGTAPPAPRIDMSPGRPAPFQNVAMPRVTPGAWRR